MEGGDKGGGEVKLCIYKCFLTFFRFTLLECKEIPLPVDKSNKEVIQLLKSKINQGIYSLSQLIVPQKFEKILLRN